MNDQDEAVLQRFAVGHVQLGVEGQIPLLEADFLGGRGGCLKQAHGQRDQGGGGKSSDETHWNVSRVMFSPDYAE